MQGAPDEVVFSAPLTEGEPQITWGALRANNDPLFRLQCLKMRIEGLLLAQSAELLKEGIYAPFPLTAVTLVGIGSLAELFYGDIVPLHHDDRNRIVFCEFAGSLHQLFSRPLTKDFKNCFAERWGVEKPRTGSQILYTFFRNSFVHGYYGRAVFLTEEDTDGVTYREDGCVLLHPRWFFTQLSSATNRHLEQMLVEQENGRLRRNALHYIKELIDERT